jgi:hypothetical protein
LTRGNARELVRYRSDTAAIGGAYEVEFDGTLLLQRDDKASRTVYAYRFRHLVLPDTITVRAPIPIVALVLRDASCDLIVESDRLDDIRIDAARPLAVTINGQPRRVG